jgi:hypothetical protein
MLADLEANIRRIIVEQPNSCASDLKLCIDSLVQLPVSSEQLNLIERLLVGAVVPDHLLTYRENIAFLEYSGWARMVNHLFENSALTYDIFKRSIQRAERLALCLNTGKPSVRQSHFQLPAQLRYAYWDQHLSEACHNVIIEYAERLTWELAEDFSYQARMILRQLNCFRGSRYLLLVASYHQQYFADLLNLQPSSQLAIPEILSCLTHILRHIELEPLMDSARHILVEQLRRYPVATLKALIVYARDGQPLLADALNLPKALPLVTLIKHISSKTYTDDYGQADIPNTADPTSGVINIAEVRDALEVAGESLARDVFELFRQSGEQVGNTLTLIEAIAGWNRTRVEKGLKSSSQIAIKAYGLLPLEKGDEEVLQRYLRLKQSAKDGKKFGQMRRASHAGAVQVAITNLAQLAGYTDAGRFEWAMEAKLAAEFAPAGRTWQVDDYELELTIEGIDVNLLTKRAGRILKSAPKHIREQDAYQEAREAVQQLRSQASRLKTGLLEGLLVTGEMLSLEELQQFLRLPLARGLFQSMVWRNESDELGLLDVDEMRLFDLGDQQHPVTGKLGLAHPYHFYQANVLAAWQRELIHRRIVQPLKQVFRELYILTPAELTTARYSNRFAGHSVDATIAARLFGARGWQIDRSRDGATPYKVFGDVQAVVEFADVWRFFGGSVPVITDRIYFQTYPVSRFARWSGQECTQNWIPLDEVSPLVFSEAMRDAELVVSIAQREGIARLSNETLAQRGSVVRALLEDLELPGVTVEGHFAYVKGRLAQYRVHLGSATIHIDPGNYLCIVPDHWGQRHEKLFLPFADENDSKISEVISKILLLLADDKIKDESILRQIQSQTPT